MKIYSINFFYNKLKIMKKFTIHNNIQLKNNENYITLGKKM